VKTKAAEAPKHREEQAPDSLGVRVPPWPRSPRKRFGQHFLEPAWVTKLIDALKTSPTDTFLEIGPGRGALTKPLAARIKRVVAVEIDRDLAAQLREDVLRGSKDRQRGSEDPRLQGRESEERLRVIEGDFLDVDLDTVLAGESLPVRVVGNLPYNVSSPILFRLLAAQDGGRRMSDATLMLQREVADRLVARPGSKAYGTLAIQVALHADVDRLLTLPPGAFRPPPKVTSAVVRLRFRPPAFDVGDAAVFERVVRGIFLQRRKTLANALKPVADSLGRSAPQLLQAAAIDGTRRPETLTLEEIARLSRAVL
jgi:16S rRNA (adenine1518-N6/adenine1519-N6)-dimethyltransferase